MSDIVEQNINIKVTAETSKAVTSLDTLAGALKTLSRLSKNGIGLAKVATEIKTFTKSLDKMSKDSVKRLQDVANAFGKLNGVKIDKSVTKAVSDMTASIPSTKGDISAPMEEIAQASREVVEQTDQWSEKEAKAFRLMNEGKTAYDAVREATSDINDELEEVSSREILSKKEMSYTETKLLALRNELEWIPKELNCLVLRSCSFCKVLPFN